MSQTTTPPAPPAAPPVSPTAPAATTTAVTSAEPIIDARFIVAMFSMVIAAGTLGAVFMIKDMSPLQGTLAGTVVGLLLNGPLGFFFGNSKTQVGTTTTTQQQQGTTTP